MTLEAWALFCLTETLLCLSPSPSALLVISLALTRGRLASLRGTVAVPCTIRRRVHEHFESRRHCK
jgi:threonine/homoserine/homoserine lactone efflux protein